MRRRLLHDSVARHLRPGETVIEAAYMWSRTGRAYVTAAAVFLAVAGGAWLFGVSSWAGRVACGIVVAVPLMMLLTEFQVVAMTSERMVALGGGRLRQVAVGPARDIDPTGIEPVGGTMLATDWSVGGATWTVPKSYEQAIQAIGMHLTTDPGSLGEPPDHT